MTPKPEQGGGFNEGYVCHTALLMSLISFDSNFEFTT